VNNPKYGKLLAAFIGSWFAFSLLTSAIHLYKTGLNQPPLALGLAVVTPILIFLVWFARSQDFRRYLLSLDPRTLTAVHSWRVTGFVFLVLYTYGVLPGIFALPAGWGDITIGATAALVAKWLADPGHRRSFIAWQVLGILDLVLAVTLATTSTLIDPGSVPTSAMTVLPLSLIPTFFVPLLLILHLICIAQARQWSARPSRVGGALLSRV
jgi:hypothetical protein